MWVEATQETQIKQWKFQQQSLRSMSTEKLKSKQVSPLRPLTLDQRNYEAKVLVNFLIFWMHLQARDSVCLYCFIHQLVSLFGRVRQLKPTTSPDNLVLTILGVTKKLHGNFEIFLQGARDKTFLPEKLLLPQSHEISHMVNRVHLRDDLFYV